MKKEKELNNKILKTQMTKESKLKDKIKKCKKHFEKVIEKKSRVEEVKNYFKN